MTKTIYRALLQRGTNTVFTRTPRLAHREDMIDVWVDGSTNKVVSEAEAIELTAKDLDATPAMVLPIKEEIETLESSPVLKVKSPVQAAINTLPSVNPTEQVKQVSMPQMSIPVLQVATPVKPLMAGME